MKQLLGTLTRVCVGCLFVYYLIEGLTFQFRADVSCFDFVQNGLLNMIDCDPSGHTFFNFIKVLMLEVCYFLFYLESIQRVGDMKRGYDQVMKYHACSRMGYLRNMIMYIVRYLLLDVLVTTLIYIFACFFLEGDFLRGIGMFGQMVLFDCLYILCLMLWTSDGKYVLSAIAALVIVHTFIRSYMWLGISITLVLCFLSITDPAAQFRRDES